MMKILRYLPVVLLIHALAGCTNSDDTSEPPDAANSAKPAESGGALVMIPNYLVINAPPEKTERPWFVSDYFRRVEQWEPETTNYNDFEMGMYELTRYPNLEPTEAQKQAADKLVNDSFDVALRNGWLSKEKGLADGYEKMFGDPVHFVNVDYVFDGETLNPEKPEVLMYYRTKEGDFLMGVMYLAIGERGPQVAGPLSKWHYHIDRGMCYEKGVLPIGRKRDDGTCEVGFHNIRSPEMLHVWFFDHPQGRFATTMGLSEELLMSGIEQVRALQNERM